MSDDDSKRGRIDASGVRIIGIWKGGSGITWPDHNQKLPRPDPEADARISAAMTANKIAEVVAIGEGLPETFFDYNRVPQENRAAALALTKSLKTAFRKHLAAMVEVGEGLMKQKEQVGPGNFELGCQPRFNGPRDTPDTTWLSRASSKAERKIFPFGIYRPLGS